MPLFVAIGAYVGAAAAPARITTSLASIGPDAVVLPLAYVVAIAAMASVQ